MPQLCLIVHEKNQLLQSSLSKWKNFCFQNLSGTAPLRRRKGWCRSRRLMGTSIHIGILKLIMVVILGILWWARRRWWGNSLDLKVRTPPAPSPNASACDFFNRSICLVVGKHVIIQLGNIKLGLFRLAPIWVELLSTGHHQSRASSDSRWFAMLN